MKRIPDVSIIISNYNSSDLINQAIESVITGAGDVGWDILVIDDASTDGGLARVDDKYKSDARITFVENKKNVGFSALNIALGRMHGRYLMTMDTDATHRPGTLRALVHFMDTHPEAGAATGNLHYPNGNVQNYYRRHMTPLVGFYTTVIGRFIDKYILGLRHYNSYHYSDLDATRVFELEMVPVASLILRREALGSQIMDPNFHLYIDVDLCKCIYDRGYKIYLVPDAYVTHIKSAAFNKQTRAWKDFKYYQGLNAYYKKHYPAYAAVMRVVLWVDQVMRGALIFTVGRAPMR
jgi:GT2 family glycosyltransferase